MARDAEPVFGYACAEPREEILPPQEQSKAIEERAGELTGDWIGCCAESDASLPWRERPILKKLLHGMHRGDHLVVYRPDRIDRAPGRLAEALAYLARRGIHVHFVNFRGEPFDLDPEKGHLVALFLVQSVGMYHDFRRDVSRESARRRKELGLAIGGHPPYGKRRVTRRQGKDDEWCRKQCAIVRELKMRRDAGECWENIAADFHRRRLRTGGKQFWVRRRQWRGQITYGLSRLKRAYRWYRDLLARGEDLGA